ncbi:hypothetical protein TBLA_0D03370 [Henningerozyma blattae CBS 6284]|uniref:CMP/dCMP-type deaminase domain-containing protein n=1 Tax=Henningerozyma blattae (strain ATCC 34711 / CBS 6284 / DSM 70876 / NBRC 10599 / NRRL Y-10934 / UCD 77-7) TaxID=1071380 RepID=I2H385_HENB6|nr:hypothetical protein TBLA_0D03370 [Tetrapisispora blattae CBS 6284]CCH60837.1 hypothetical protein TBLA_0D03370 [Tetrapisispora blattae CBS 6284]
MGQQLPPVDCKWMELAVKLSRYALEVNETPIACVIVNHDTNKLVSYGINYTNASLRGTAHAEFQAMELIREKVSNDSSFLQNCTLYVTVEPCIMCASLLQQLNIKRVVFGASNDRFGGNGTVLKIQDYIVLKGLMYKEAILLLRMFYNKENKSAPLPRLKSNRKLDMASFPSQEIDSEISSINSTTIRWDLLNTVPERTFIKELDKQIRTPA